MLRNQKKITASRLLDDLEALGARRWFSGGWVSSIIPKKTEVCSFKPSGHTCSCLSISPGPAHPRMLWSTAHLLVTQPPSWFQSCISTPDWWEGCQCLLLGLLPAVYLNPCSVMASWLQPMFYIVTGALDKLLLTLSVRYISESYQGRPFRCSALNFAVPCYFSYHDVGIWKLLSCCGSPGLYDLIS